MTLSFNAQLVDIPNGRDQLRKIDKVADKIGVFIDKRFELTYRTWENKPKFITTKRKTRRQIKVFVYTTDKIYGFVSCGTRVRRAIMLPPFRGKTKPGRIRAIRGQFSGVVISRKFNRPGIKARKFDEQILPSVQKRLRKLLRRIT